MFTTLSDIHIEPQTEVLLPVTGTFIVQNKSAGTAVVLRSVSSTE